MDDTASAVYAAAENDTSGASKALIRGGAQTSLRIEPQSSRQRLDLRELWAFRELLFFFIWRDVKVRYKQTVLGAAWALIQPLMTMVVFTIFFGKLGGMAGQVKGSYSVFVYAALLPWTFFANAVTQGALSLIGSSHLISKVYFPRVLVPIAAIASGLVDFSIAFLVMLVLMIANGVSPTWQILALPLFVAGTLATATGVSMLLSALVVAYRDFRYVVGFLVQIWMFASPVIYPLDIVPERWRLAYATNPMVGMISGFRSATLGEPFATSAIAVSSIVAAMLLVGGAQYFLQVQRRFADII